MAPRKLIIDTDPGQDDAFALLMALGAPDELEVLGITVVHGNVPLEKAAFNARQVVELAGRPEVPVFAGCPRPMIFPPRTAEYVHGDSGLDGCELPPPRIPLQERHGVDFIVDTIMAAASGEITVCTLGPMTNLAMAMVKEPAIVPRIREVVLMGGGFFEGGNTTPAAEFNILVDPHAAHVVFESGVKLTMVPIDCTYRALMTPEWIAALRDHGSHVAVQAAGMAAFYQRYGNEKFSTDRYPLHDPCVIGWLLRPELFEGRICKVAIEIASPLTAGMTVVDWWNVTKEPPNCHVLRHVEAEPFYALLREKILALG